MDIGYRASPPARPLELEPLQVRDKLGWSRLARALRLEQAEAFKLTDRPIDAAPAGLPPDDALRRPPTHRARPGKGHRRSEDEARVGGGARRLVARHHAVLPDAVPFPQRTHDAAVIRFFSMVIHNLEPGHG